LLLIDPRWALALLLAVLAGMVLAAGLALAGVHALDSGVVDRSATHGRLAGTYGNSNYLGTAIAGGFALLVAFRPRRIPRRTASIALVVSWAMAGAIISTALVLTYSRSSLVAAAFGGLAALVLEFESSRGRLLAGVAGFGALLVLAVLVYPTIEGERRAVSYRQPSRELRFIDTGGWDGRSQGLIPDGPAAFHNASDATTLVVIPKAPRAGVSFPWGRAKRGITYRLRFEARSSKGSAELGFGMEDNQLANGARSSTARLTTRWRRLSIAWRPTAASPSARLYTWRAAGPGPFQVRDVRIGSRQIATTLLGTEYRRVLAGQSRDEKHGEESRLTGIRLGLQAFWAEPLRGIGWDNFPQYAARHSRFGRLASHNEYVRIAAELGLLGVLAMLIVMAILLSQIARVRASRTSRAAAGLVVTGGVGLLFLNGLVAPAVSIPFAIAGAILCTAGGDSHEPHSDPQDHGTGLPDERARLHA
jgi:O-antigen ligase